MTRPINDEASAVTAAQPVDCWTRGDVGLTAIAMAWGPSFAAIKSMERITCSTVSA